MRDFRKEHGVELFEPPTVLDAQVPEGSSSGWSARTTAHFNTLWNMASKAKFALMRRFFETIATRVKHVYDIANRDVESWLKSVMSPLETQVREHHMQLRRRLESVKRIHRASDELEERHQPSSSNQAEALSSRSRALREAIARDRRPSWQPELTARSRQTADAAGAAPAAGAASAGRPRLRP